MSRPIVTIAATAASIAVLGLLALDTVQPAFADDPDALAAVELVLDGDENGLKEAVARLSDRQRGCVLSAVAEGEGNFSPEGELTHAKDIETSFDALLVSSCTR